MNDKSQIGEKLPFSKKIFYSLRRIGSIYIGTAADWMRSKEALFFTFIFPVIMIILMGSIFGGGSTTTQFDVYYVNEDIYQAADGSMVSYNPTNELLESMGLNNDSLASELNIRLVKVAYNSTLHDASDWTGANDYSNLMVIPKGWSEAANLTETDPNAPKANISFYYDPSYSSALTIMQILTDILHDMNAEKFGLVSHIDVEVETTPNREGLDGIDFYVPGMIMVTLCTSGILGVVSNVTSQRSTGFLYKLSATPVKKWEWAFAIELWQITIGFGISLVSILTGWLVYGFNLSMLHPLMILPVIFGSMAFAGMALIISRFVKRPEAAAAAAMMIVFPMMFLSNSIMPVSMMPNFLAKVAQFIPLYYANEAMKSLMLESTMSNFGYYFGILVVIGIGFFVIGTLIMDWKKE